MSLSSVVRRLGLVLFSLAALYAQTDLATVTGGVTDPHAAAMPGVTVRIRNVETNISRSIVTNTEGYFTITNLNPGPYELIAEQTGFRPFRETAIVLEVGQSLRLDVPMQLASVDQTVSVTADIAPLNTENGAIKG